MANTETLVALGSVAIGWFLSEVSHARRSLAAKRGALGQVLADLLGIREQLLGRVYAVPGALGEVLMDQADVRTRYIRTLSEIASYDPILAFRLRAKERIPAALAGLREFGVSQGQAPSDADGLQDFLRSISMETLDHAIREVAWHYGLVTALRVRTLLKATAPAAKPAGK